MVDLTSVLVPDNCGLCGGAPEATMTLSDRDTGGWLWAHQSCYRDVKERCNLRIVGETRTLTFARSGDQ